MMAEEHIVKVGPVHAGIIEPGVFRFVCSGEKVLKVDLELGFQHRAIEHQIVASHGNVWRMMALAEQIAGDSTIAHAMAMVRILDPLTVSPVVRSERRVALEMERIAMNLADASAMAGDMSYRLAHVALQALRTLTINAMQRWSGNRFGRTLIRPAGSFYRLDLDLIQDFKQTLASVLPRAEAVRKDLFSSPSVLSRLEDVCVMNVAVGRYDGDLATRLEMRFAEIVSSGLKIDKELHYLMASWVEPYVAPQMEMPILAPGTTLTSRIEGWRGRITHRAQTDEDGRIVRYKIIDPSLSLWPVLVSSMEGGEISDFPLHNKSFNLSYSAVDL